MHSSTMYPTVVSRLVRAGLLGLALVAVVSVMVGTAAAQYSLERDSDGDGTRDVDDNCPLHFNPGQQGGAWIGSACNVQGNGSNYISFSQGSEGDSYLTVARSTEGGNLMVSIPGVGNFYAFQFVDSGTAYATTTDGFDSLNAYSPAQILLSFEGLELRYQSPDLGEPGIGKFIEIYATRSVASLTAEEIAAGMEPGFELTAAGNTLARGTHMVLTVVTESIGPDAGSAVAFGEFWIQGPDTPFVQEVLAQSPQGVLAMMSSNFVSLESTPGQGPHVRGTFDVTFDISIADLRTGSDIVLVMDRSGSMGQPSQVPGMTKLEALQYAAEEFVALLDLSGEHGLGLVKFEEDVVPFAPPFPFTTLADETDIEAARSAIGSMTSGGWTNIIAGVETAVDQLPGVSADDTRRQTVVLFTDGKHNRPVGSDLNDVAGLLSRDTRFFSIGFGTDIDDEILVPIALEHGGFQLNEPLLDPLGLSKLFLLVGGSALGDETINDPRFEIGPQEQARLVFPVSADVSDFTVAVNWITPEPRHVAVALHTPDGRCVIDVAEPPVGVAVRNGDRYALVRVDLPLWCRDKYVSVGTWEIVARCGDLAAGETEQVEILVMASTGTRVTTTNEVDDDGVRLVGRFLAGEDIVTGAEVFAEISPPTSPTLDSEAADEAGTRDVPFEGPRVEIRKPIRVPLLDDGGAHDQAKGDGVYTGFLSLDEQGLYRVRLVAGHPDARLNLRREAVSSFYYAGPSTTPWTPLVIVAVVVLAVLFGLVFRRRGSG